MAIPQDAIASPFFHVFMVDEAKITVPKKEFALAIEAEGIGINSHYPCLVMDWQWFAGLCASPVSTPNTKAFRDKSFNLLFHENYSNADVDDVIAAFKKVESALIK